MIDESVNMTYKVEFSSMRWPEEEKFLCADKVSCNDLAQILGLNADNALKKVSLKTAYGNVCHYFKIDQEINGEVIGYKLEKPGFNSLDVVIDFESKEVKKEKKFNTGYNMGYPTTLLHLKNHYFTEKVNLCMIYSGDLKNLPNFNLISQKLADYFESKDSRVAKNKDELNNEFSMYASRIKLFSDNKKK